MAREQSENEAPASRSPISLDGRTLEGGGQLVRIAVVLSVLTGKPITVDHIRGNRTGKKGLKNSHLAAIKSLVDMSGSAVKGDRVHSSWLILHPPSQIGSTNTGRQEESTRIGPDINIRLPTAGSVFLVFQALYPYLLHAGSLSSEPTEPIRLSITGGTNVSFSPTYDYVQQVLIPNFTLLGLPRLSLELETRGWSFGPSNLGKVTFLVDTLQKDCSDNCRNRSSKYQFPAINLNRYRRGAVSRIDVTILAPDNPFLQSSSGGRRGNKKGKKDHRKSSFARRDVQYSGQDDFDGQSGSSGSVREFMEREIRRSLRKQLKKLPTSIFSIPAPSADSMITPDLDDDDEPIVPINTHTTEATHHPSYLYVLIVAHMVNGLKIGHDALFGSQRGGEGAGNKGRDDIFSTARDLVGVCVDGFIQELYDPRLQKDMPGRVGHQPCVDQHMRDQLVVFEALGRVSGQDPEWGGEVEDERYWSLHTKTAQWVCRQLLGGGVV